jgi:hypothetical protein
MSLLPSLSYAFPSQPIPSYFLRTYTPAAALEDISFQTFAVFGCLAKNGRGFFKNCWLCRPAQRIQPLGKSGLNDIQ